MGLGPVGDVTLAEAREAAREARRHLAAGRDPLVERGRETKVKTFGEYADAYLEAMKPQWANAKHVYQWETALQKHAVNLRPKPIADIDTSDVMQALKTIWTKTPETASRVRGRIEAVLDAAKAQGLRKGDNPARWRGHLDQLLPKRQKLTRGHHAAMPYADVPAFLRQVRTSDSTSALALEFTILTAARSGETIGAEWREIDLTGALWTVPAKRMKAGREHRVPLVGRALEIVTTLAEAGQGGFVFAGQRRDKPMSNMALSMTLRRLGADVTVHGFRSSFRDWAAERTDTPHEVAEMALAHTIASAVERAYRRGDMFEKRRELMAAWAAYCGDGP
jgi:integrase